MLITVLKPLAVEKHHVLHASFITDCSAASLYCVAQPHGRRSRQLPGLDAARDSGPSGSCWSLGAVGSVAYLVVGYVVFKRLEVNFADLT